MAAVIPLPTAVRRPVPAQRIRGACPPNVVPAYRLAIRRRARNQRHDPRVGGRKEMLETLDALKQAASTGKIDGLVYIVRAGGHEKRAGLAGCFNSADREAALEKMTSVLKEIVALIE